jgi:TrmH family RNA methyltransferase
VPVEPTPIPRHHPLLTEFRRAFKSGPPLVAIEGPRLIGEAIRSGFRVERALFSRTGLEHHGDKLLPQFSKHTTAAVADDGPFAAAMDAEHPQGVAALVRFTPAALAEAFGKEGAVPLLLAAAEMQDPGNLGTLIRAADAFGATGFVALADTVSPFNPKALRASAGSIFHLPVVAKVTAAELIAACRARNVALLATAARASGNDPNEALSGLDRPVCIVIGQEGAGVPRELLRAAGRTIAIPMQRSIESLNAGAAGAILLYEAARQRR